MNCKERLPQEFKNTKNFFLTLTGNPSAKWLDEYGFDYNDPDDRLTAYVSERVLELSFTENLHGVKVPAHLAPVVALLSTGGPADGFILGVNPRKYNRIEFVAYFYQDWFDGASRKLNDGSRFESAVIEVFEPWLESLDYDQWLEDIA